MHIISCILGNNQFSLSRIVPALQIFLLNVVNEIFSSPGLIKKLEEENKVNAYLCQDKLLKEIDAKRKACQDLERVVNEPAMGQSDLDEINSQVGCFFPIIIKETTKWEPIGV